MNTYHVRHLPIVNDEQLLGLVSEEDILIQENAAALGSYELSAIRPSVKDSEHIFDIMRKMAEYNLTVIPVVDYEDNYKGLVTLETILDYYGKSFSFSESGCIIVISTQRQNYALSEIAQIVEGEGAAILTSFISFIDNSSQVEITLKLNVQDPTRAQAALERYSYTIKGTFREEVLVEQLQDRYDMLMTYLNV